MDYYLKVSNYTTTTIEKENKEVVFQLKHNGLIGRKAIAQLPTTLYEMEHANFWGSRYNIIKDGSHIGAVSRNWSGERLIHLKDKDHQPIQFKLKQQSFLIFNLTFGLMINII